MFGGDEVIFTGQYKGFKLGIAFDLKGKEPEEVAQVLAYVSSKLEQPAFEFSEIDTKKIDGMAKVKGTGLKAIVEFIESAGKLRDELGKCVNNPKLICVAECYLFNKLLTQANVQFKIVPTNAPKPSDEKIEDFIGFVGKYKEWVAIKKLGLGKVQDYEVSGILSGVNHSIVNKAFDFAGVNKNDALVDSVVKGKRKSYNNLAAALKELEPKLSKNQDDAYVVCKVFENLGYKPYASPDMLTDAHPDIKPPKVKGRKPKG
ncbi:Uncharacterised protein [Candidatus Bilamarchaeum dharawalense]|uniref:DUF2666 domain-containing protein n=1 Tax=Candidatus Bilamarchaeum dharawalense TaxID=2885759 RepID=A0A5E4LT95_9ARCH|nr:Uncharacterised protein [Candidatus Bilamarchaeum dharawalense]